MFVNGTPGGVVVSGFASKGFESISGWMFFHDTQSDFGSTRAVLRKRRR